LNLHSLSGSSSVEWLQGYLVSKRQPLTWYKVSIVIPLYYPAKHFHLSIDSGVSQGLHEPFFDYLTKNELEDRND